MTRILEALAGAGKAGTNVLNTQRRFERTVLENLLRNFQTLKRSLSNRLLDGITDFRRFNLQALIADVDRLIGETETALQQVAAAGIQASAQNGQAGVDEPLKAAGMIVTPALPGLDADLVAASFGNTVDLLTPPMKQFGADVKAGLRRVALAGDSRMEEIQRLRDKISGAGFDAAQFKAERIIRTEVGRTFNAAQFERMKVLARDFPFLRKGWRSAKDSRTRIGHREAGTVYTRGQGIPIFTPFRVKVYDERDGKAPKQIGTATLQFPLDPEATPAGRLAAGATIMCRCNAFVDFSPAELAQFNRQRVSQALGVPVTPPTPPTPPVTPPVPPVVKPKPTPKPRVKPAPKPKPVPVVPAFDPNNPAQVRAKLDELAKSPAGQAAQKLQAELKRLEGEVRRLSIELTSMADTIRDRLIKAAGGYFPGSPGPAATWQAANARVQLDPDFKIRQDELNLLKAQLKATTALWAAERRQLIDQARTLVTLKGGQRIVMSITQTPTAASDPNIQAGLKWFQDLVGIQPQGLRNTVRIEAYGGRAHYSGGTVKTTRELETVVHELGHWLEDRIPEVHEQAVAFLVRRTAGETAASLRNLTGKPYKTTERATGDQFGEVYSGKWYTYKSVIAGKIELKTWADVVKFVNASEVVSMGLQQMIEDPMKFAAEDPDYFDFMFNLVRGAAKEQAPSHPSGWNHVDGAKPVPDASGSIPKLKKTQLWKRP